MGWLGKVKSSIQRVNRFIAGVGAIFLIPLMLITAAEVIGRNLFNRPITGCVELSEYMLSIFILLGLAYSQQIKAHVGVSFFISRLSHRSQLILNIITILLSLLMFSILAWQGWKIGIEERTVSDMLRIPQYPFRLLVALAASFVCLELLIDFVDVLKKLSGRAT
jgi:TRAP-type C4-dicarboxylate transport system permease small subunit